MKRAVQGLSLTELLVATALMGMAIAGGLSGFLRTRAAQSDASALQQLHERAQYVFGTLEPELQMAGFFAHDAPPPRWPVALLPPAALRCGETLIAHLDQPLDVSTAWNKPCEARGGGAITGSDVLTLRRLAAQPASAPQAGRAQWLSRAAAPGQGQLYWQGEAPWNPADAVRGDSLRELLVHIYYVAQAADGDPSTPALRVKSLTSIAGVPAFIDTEVMHGIEHLHAELLPSPIAPSAVRLRLRIRADTAAAGTSAPRTLDVARHFSLRNAPHAD